ncbi:MAG: hypothetical protein EOO40_00355 [Deltaproteobacteria bacterium]|nr:MAG: hypothetical protein EOO40_00355 [Deltaproteobacteria bacterium]
MTTSDAELTYSAWVIERDTNTAYLLYTYASEKDADDCSDAYCKAHNLDGTKWLRKTIKQVVRPTFDPATHKHAMALLPGIVGDHSHL